VKALIRKLQLCLLNDMDFVDLVSELVRMSSNEEYKGKERKKKKRKSA
jgi:hypothetical protein